MSKKKRKFIYGRRENHEVFSLVDERCASALAFNGVTNRLLAGIPDGTTEVSIAPERPLLPKLFSQIPFVSSPKLHRRFLCATCVPSLVARIPGSECDLDQLQAPQKKSLSEWRSLRSVVSPHLHMPRAISFGMSKRRSSERE